jgi:hypothetical protein
MNRIIAALSVQLVLAATATPVLARAHHQRAADPAPYSTIDSGYGPPANWNEIEISHPEGGGN